MSDGNNVHPRTRQDLDTWRIRTIRRRDAMSTRRIASRTGAKVATVLEVAPNGDVKVDRLTDEDGEGEWLTPVNGRTPPVGGLVVMDHIEGAPAVMGAVGEGDWKIVPDHSLMEPGYYFPPDSTLGGMNENQDPPTVGTYAWSPQENEPFISVDPMNPRVYLGAPPFIAPQGLYWYDHFTGGGASTEAIGREGWATTGTGSITAPGVGHFIRLATGATNGNTRSVYLGANATRTMFIIGDSDDGIAEAWFLFRITQTTNTVVRAGLGQNITTASPTDGLYWDFSSTLSADARIVGAGTNVTQPMFTWTSGQKYLVSVRAEPDRSGDEYLATRLTFTRWGHVDGVLAPIQRYETVITQFGAFFGCPEFGIRTTAAAAKSADLDYAAGFYYSGSTEFGLY